MSSEVTQDNTDDDIQHEALEVTTLQTQLAKADLDSVEWIVDGIIEFGAVTLLYGAPGSAKSLVSLDLALSAATGRKWMGAYEIDRQQVLYVDEDGNNERSLNSRLKAFQVGDPVREHADIHFHLHKGFTLTDDDWRKRMIADCKRRKVSLVIMDSMTRLHNLKESDASDMKQLSKALKEFALANISVVMLHHANKQGKIARGSSEIESAYDAIYRMIKVDSSTFLMEPTKSRTVSSSGVWGGCVVKVVSPSPGGILLDGSQQLGNSGNLSSTKRDRFRQGILDALSDGDELTETALIASIGARSTDRDLVKELLAELVGEGEILHIKRGKGSYFSLAEADDDLDDDEEGDED